MSRVSKKILVLDSFNPSHMRASDLNIQFSIDDAISKYNKDDFTVVIPVLNEEEAIGRVIEDVKLEGYRNILVVDGYSTDNTFSIASDNGVKVIYQKGVGKTGAISTAIDQVVTPYLVVMDGDCTYDPQDISNFFPHIANYDEIIGSRTYGRKNIPFFNRFGNFVINLFFNLLFGTNLVDVCSGMYALRTDFFKTLDLKTKGFDVEVEIAAQAATFGKISQVPIKYHERVGQQKLIPWKHGSQIFLSIFWLASLYNSIFQLILIALLSLIPILLIFIGLSIQWTMGTWNNLFITLGTITSIIWLSSISYFYNRARATRKTGYKF